MKVAKVLPFRLKSKRFPNKYITDFEGKSLLEHSLILSNNINFGDTIITSPKEDFDKAVEVCNLKDYDYDFIPTSKHCESATDRIVEISRNYDYDIYLSIPVDEVLLLKEEIESSVWEILNEDEFQVYTFYCNFFCEEDAVSHLSAKIVMNQNKEVQYMSRAIIPSNKNGTFNLEKLKKNVGIFIFTAKFLDDLFNKRNIPTSWDKIEGLEQLRWIELGFPLKLKKIIHYGFGIDVPEQIIRLKERMACIPKQTK